MNTKRIVLLFTCSLLAALTLVTPAAAQEMVPYKTVPGDSVPSIAGRFCTSWQEVYQNNQGVLGTNPNVVRPGVLIYVIDRCRQPNQPPGGVYDRGPRDGAAGHVSGNSYVSALNDSFTAIGDRFGLSWREVSRANGGGEIYPGRRLVIPGLPQWPTQPPAQNASLSFVSPQAFTVLPQRFTVSGTAQGIYGNNISIRATDRSGRVLAQTVTNARGHDVNTGGPGTWSAQLEVYTAPGTQGQIMAVASGTSANESIDVTFGGESQPPPAQSQISIVSPTRSSVLPPTFTASGTGQNLPSGNVTIRALDSVGRVLAEQITTLQGHNVDIGGSGTWTAQMTVYTTPGSPGKIIAFSPGATASQSVDITYGRSDPPSSAQSDINIVSPSPFTTLPQTFTVSGIGHNLIEGNVVVQALGSGGRVLDEQATILQGHDVGLGGSGTWSAQMTVSRPPGTQGQIKAFSPETDANHAISVIFGGAGNRPPSTSPIRSFRVDSTNIKPGDCVRFYWDVQGAQAVYFYREGDRWQDNKVEPNPDHYSACPPYTSAHYLRAIKQDGSFDERSLTINVR